MTANQLKLAEIKETTRHNVRTEGQTDVGLAEAQRHNVQQERTNWYVAGSNREIGLANIALQQRSVAIAESKLPYEQDVMVAQFEKTVAEAQKAWSQKRQIDEVTPFQIADYESQASRRAQQNITEESIRYKSYVDPTVSAITKLLPFFIVPTMVK